MKWSYGLDKIVTQFQLFLPSTKNYYDLLDIKLGLFVAELVEIVRVYPAFVMTEAVDNCCVPIRFTSLMETLHTSCESRECKFRSCGSISGKSSTLW